MIPLDKPPSIQYPIGAIIEDCNAKSKILRFQKDRGGAHLYYVKILEWKIPPPDYVKNNQDTDFMWILVTASSVEKIQVLSLE